MILQLSTKQAYLITSKHLFFTQVTKKNPKLKNVSILVFVLLGCDLFSKEQIFKVFR